MDYFLKWPNVVPIRNQKTSMLAEVLLKNVIARHDEPQEVHSDQEKIEFEVCKELLNLLCTKKAVP